jgi:SSS family solute:Na+ symporter
LQNVGFEAIFFLGAMLLVLSIYLRSNAVDKVQDPKAVSIDLALFRSDRAFTLGAIGVIVILAILYVALW